MIRRRVLVLILSVSFLLAGLTVSTNEASPTLRFGFVPDVTIGIAPGATFVLYLTAFDVTDLFLPEYWVFWDPAILNTTVGNITTGDTAPYLEFFWIKDLHAAWGRLHIVVGRPVGVTTGLSGDVQTAKINFTVVAEGSSGLYVGWPRLMDSGGVDMAIDKIIDGFFASSAMLSHYAFACNSTGALQNVFAEGETVYVVGGGFSAKRFVDIYVVLNYWGDWDDGDPIGTPVVPKVTVETVRNPAAPHLRFGVPITALGTPPVGFYDIMVDFDQDGVYDAAFDGVDEDHMYPGFGLPRFDVAVVDVTLSKTVVEQGYSVSIKVTVENQGVFEEAFNVTVYADQDKTVVGDEFTIGERTVYDLMPYARRTLTFMWNTTGVAKGNYTITAYATPVPGETAPDQLDNTLTGWVFVTILGDVNGDRVVDGSDVVIVIEHVPSYPGHPNWDPNCDLNDDNVVDGSDVVIIIERVPSYW